MGWKALEILGFRTYEDYLNSKHWKDFRKAYSASNRPKTCQGCGVGQYQLHHTSYKNLGSEKLTDVMPLCQTCHKKVHELLQFWGRYVGETEWALKFIHAGTENDWALINESIRGNGGQQPPKVPVKRQPTAKGSVRLQCPQCPNVRRRKAKLCRACMRRDKPTKILLPTVEKEINFAAEAMMNFHKSLGKSKKSRKSRKLRRRSSIPLPLT